MFHNGLKSPTSYHFSYQHYLLGCRLPSYLLLTSLQLSTEVGSAVRSKYFCELSFFFRVVSKNQVIMSWPNPMHCGIHGRKLNVHISFLLMNFYMGPWTVLAFLLSLLINCSRVPWVFFSRGLDYCVYPYNINKVKLTNNTTIIDFEASSLWLSCCAAVSQRHRLWWNYREVEHRRSLDMEWSQRFFREFTWMLPMHLKWTFLSKWMFHGLTQVVVFKQRLSVLWSGVKLVWQAQPVKSLAFNWDNRSK